MNSRWPQTQSAYSLYSSAIYIIFSFSLSLQTVVSTDVLVYIRVPFAAVSVNCFTYFVYNMLPRRWYMCIDRYTYRAYIIIHNACARFDFIL